MSDSYYLSDLEHKVELLWWQKQGLSYTASGYGKKIPTHHMVKLPDDTRWRRVYCCIYSNSGTCYVVKNNEWIIIHQSNGQTMAWERRWYSGEVIVYCRYDDDSTSWIVRAICKDTKATVRVPDKDWLQITREPVNTTEAYLYATTRGMNIIVEDDNNKVIRDNCSYTNIHSVHVGRSFNAAWSDYDRDIMSRR